jgi:hypothetical protein
MLALRIATPLLAFVLQLPSSDSTTEQANWARFEPKEAGFSIEMPGVPMPDSSPGQFVYMFGGWSFMVQIEPIDVYVRDRIKAGDRREIVKILESIRDSTVEGFNGSVRSSSSADFDGRPSLVFSFDGETNKIPLEGTERIVLTEGSLYGVIALGPKRKPMTKEVARFMEGFRLVEPVAVNGIFQTVSFTDAVCAHIPPVPISFDMPTDFGARAIPGSSEAGCLWGVKEDLDRVLKVPDEGDFSALRRGVFRLRMSTNIVCGPESGVFDQMDGSGEQGIRQQLEATGATVVIWKKETLAGLPALQIVADFAGRRAYMLYLGNTHYVSNTLLVNYYHPLKRSDLDDVLWARFVAGIKKTKNRDAG